MFSHHFVHFWSAFFLGSADLPSYTKRDVAHLCWSHPLVSRRCMQMSIWNQNLSQTKVAIMPANITPVIIEYIFQFSGQGLSQSEMSRITGVSQGVI